LPHKYKNSLAFKDGFLT